MKNICDAIIILTLILYINLFNVIDAYDCPISDGFFTDPYDPHYYYQCIGNRAYHFECAGDLVFDVELKQCNWPTEDITRRPTTTTTTTTTTTDTPGPTVTRTRHMDETTVANTGTEQSPDVSVLTTTTTNSVISTTATVVITSEETTRGRHETSTTQP